MTSSDSPSMAATKQSRTPQAISLRGSCDIVTEFFKYGVNTYVCLLSLLPSSLTMVALARILFQRGVYPSDDFHMVKKYGQTVLVTQDLALENYLNRYVVSTRLDILFYRSKSHSYL